MQMKYIRVRAYFPDGKFTGFDHLYITDSQADALVRFRKENPEYHSCTAIAENFDPEKSEASKSAFEAFRRCGCVHFW